MADRENAVYQAKLAEQAERYDGKISNISRSAPPPPVSPSLSSAGGCEEQQQVRWWLAMDPLLSDQPRNKMAEKQPVDFYQALNIVVVNRVPLPTLATG
jgi:hypothetical protein